MGYSGVQEDSLRNVLWSASEHQHVQTAPGAKVYFQAPPLPPSQNRIAPPAGYPGLRAEGLQLQLIPPGPAPTTSSNAEPTLTPPSAQASGSTVDGHISSVAHYADASTSWGYPSLKPTWDGETSPSSDVVPDPSRKTGGVVKRTTRKKGPKPRKRPGEACIPCKGVARACDGVKGSGIPCS
ncbi:hypothetical protein OBBRIDRAFT_138761 [Obba rivulosa]|uniref:Uncharacterized protein n=1 Tax=Obba rivulosa TaxID=1052685 RepID=A0A8E2AY81_9APHY|nr:hypothetical protein OBBRIDRAFT_138761 [Obba rivulosa]